jgi:hypothetical protein
MQLAFFLPVARRRETGAAWRRPAVRRIPSFVCAGRVRWDAPGSARFAFPALRSIPVSRKSVQALFYVAIEAIQRLVAPENREETR